MNGGTEPSGWVPRSNAVADAITIPARGSVGFVGYQESDFWCGPLCYQVRSTRSTMSTRFLYYVLKARQAEIVALQQTGSIPALNKSQLVSLCVPVPPLEVQREIVRVLNKFTELEAGLEAELEARRGQLAYYKHLLLEENPGIGGWGSVSLGDVSEIFVGFPFKSAQFSQSPSGVRLVRGDNVGQGSLKRSDFKRWERSASDGLGRYELREGDVVLAMDRPWVPAGLKWARIEADEVPSLLVQRVARLRGIPGVVDQGFLGWVISSSRFTEHVLSSQTGNTVPHISGSSIARFTFSLPPLAEQERIASTISTFDALVNDLNLGIPAELHARRKQYQYYRDRLLTFQETQT